MLLDILYKIKRIESPVLFIIVLEALSQEFQTGTPFKLLYADDLVISAESETELLNRLGRWKREFLFYLFIYKGLRVNVGIKKQRSSLSVMILVSLKTLVNTLVVSVGKGLVTIPFAAKAVLIRFIKKYSGIVWTLHVQSRVE